jgi:hypothetical protein
LEGGTSGPWTFGGGPFDSGSAQVSLCQGGSGAAPVLTSQTTMTLVITNPSPIATTPGGLWAAGPGSIAWNLYGVVQFVSSVNSTPESLMAKGLDATQAMTTTASPLWMTAAFALGVFGELGLSLLLLRRHVCLRVLAVSPVAYLALYIGDTTEGVFAAMGAGQVAALTLVALSAAGLLWVARRASIRGLLA